MAISTLNYREWEFELDRELTQQVYARVANSGADACSCNDCKNYVAYRDHVFPPEFTSLLAALGIDYRKEVEVFRYEILPSGLHHIAGWFHFKGRVVVGPDYRDPLPNGGHTIHLTSITDNFSVGFAEGSDLTHFPEKTGLVQIEFETAIPWVIDKSLEAGD